MFLRLTGISYKTILKEEWSNITETVISYREATSEIDKYYPVIVSKNEIEFFEDVEGVTFIYFKSNRTLAVKESINQIEKLLIVGNICHFN